MDRLWNLARVCAAGLLLGIALTLPTSAGGPVTITFWHGMSGVLQPAVNELTEDFNKLNPGIVVQAQYQGNYGVLNQKLIASVAAGNPPTISQVYANWTLVLIKANAIIPMERFIKGPDGLSAENINDILAPLRQANTFDGAPERG